LSTTKRETINTFLYSILQASSTHYPQSEENLQLLLTTLVVNALALTDEDGPSSHEPDYPQVLAVSCPLTLPHSLPHTLRVRYTDVWPHTLPAYNRRFWPRLLPRHGRRRRRVKSVVKSVVNSVVKSVVKSIVKSVVSRKRPLPVLRTSSNCYISSVRILLHVSSYGCICVIILQASFSLSAQAASGVLPDILLNISSVLILLHTCPHAAGCWSSFLEDSFSGSISRLIESP